MFCCIVAADFCVAFHKASAFNGDLSLWDVSSVKSMDGSKSLCGLS